MIDIVKFKKAIKESPLNELTLWNYPEKQFKEDLSKLQKHFEIENFGMFKSFKLK